MSAKADGRLGIDLRAPNGARSFAADMPTRPTRRPRPQRHAISPPVPRGAAERARPVGEVGVETASRDMGPFYALRFRNFRLYFVGQLISVAGTWMQMVAQQWLVWSLTHQSRWLGIVSGASAIPYVIFSFHGGELADRIPRRATMVWTQSASMVLAFVLALLATDRWVRIQPWHVALMAGLLGIVNAYNMPAQQAFITDMVDERNALGNAIALNSLRFNLARVLGPMFAGYTLARAGAAMCFLLNGVSFIAVIISLLMMRLPAAERIHQRQPISEGFGYIRDNPGVLRTISLIGAASLLTWSASTIYPVFATLFHRGAAGFSTLLTVNGMGAALGGFAIALFGARLPRREQVYGGSLVFCVSLLMLAASRTWMWALLSLFIGGFAMIVFGISANTRVQEEVPDALRGRVMAVYTLVFQGIQPAGGLEIGFLAQHIGAEMGVAVNALADLVLTAGLYGWSISSRRRRR